MKTQLVKITRSKDESPWWQTSRKPSSAPTGQVVVKKRRPLSDRYHSVKEVADRFGVGTHLIYGLIDAGKLQAEVIGRTYRISQEALEEYLDSARKKLG